MATTLDKPAQPTQAARQRAANLRTALVLASIAVLFFFGIMVARYVGDGESGMTVLGIAVLLFLGVAIGRNLWKARK